MTFFALLILNFFTRVKLAIQINLLGPSAKGTLAQFLNFHLKKALIAYKLKISVSFQTSKMKHYFTFSLTILIHYQSPTVGSAFASNNFHIQIPSIVRHFTLINNQTL